MNVSSEASAVTSLIAPLLFTFAVSFYCVTEVLGCWGAMVDTVIVCGMFNDDELAEDKQHSDMQIIKHFQNSDVST